MGMSASQVRYCMLQARKTDIEFQGQQINQQRTTLATQSAAYNTELLTISVPTPPSTEEFTNTTYEFSYNGSDYTIKAINYMKEDYTVVDKDGNTNKYDAGTYVINYTSKQTQDTGSRGAKYGVVQRTEKDANGNSVQSLYVALNGESFKLSKVDEEKDADNISINSIVSDQPEFDSDTEIPKDQTGQEDKIILNHVVKRIIIPGTGCDKPSKYDFLNIYKFLLISK